MDALRGHHARRSAARRNRGNPVAEVPKPKHGGTFFHCTEVMASVKRKDGTVNIECHEVTNTPTHFRTAAGYRRHWRLFHG